MKLCHILCLLPSFNQSVPSSKFLILKNIKTSRKYKSRNLPMLCVGDWLKKSSESKLSIWVLIAKKCGSESWIRGMLTNQLQILGTGGRTTEVSGSERATVLKTGVKNYSGDWCKWERTDYETKLPALHSQLCPIFATKPKQVSWSLCTSIFSPEIWKVMMTPLSQDLCEDYRS